eukprot:scaffold174311_cov41-Prasinocladus_malaysianus.AAC.1
MLGLGEFVSFCARSDVEFALIVLTDATTVKDAVRFKLRVCSSSLTADCWCDDRGDFRCRSELLMPLARSGVVGLGGICGTTSVDLLALR